MYTFNNTSQPTLAAILKVKIASLTPQQRAKLMQGWADAEQFIQDLAQIECSEE